MLKKTTLAVVGLAIHSFAFACEANQWSFGVDALYLKALNSDPMAYRMNTLGGFTEINNQWNWGFRAAGAYQYNTGNDLSVSWLHYSNTDAIYNLAGPFFAIPSLPYTLSAQNRIDQVNAVTGQQINAGIIDKVRFYAGLQYAAIQQNMTSYYTLGSYFDYNDFKGAGPIVGIDYSYEVSPQISLIANGATSLLYGTKRMSTGFVITAAGTPVVLAPGYASKKTVVPGFEAKLGLNYAYTMPQGTINVQGGYQITDYFHVLQARGSVDPTAAIKPVDYALYGPYVGLKYVGNA
jgi:hypothetical protein